MQSKFTIMRQGRERLLREAEFARTREHKKWMKENESKFAQQWEDHCRKLRAQQPTFVWWDPKTW